MIFKVALIALSWIAARHCAPVEQSPAQLMLVTPHKINLKNILEDFKPISKFNEAQVPLVQANDPVTEDGVVALNLVKNSFKNKDEEEEVPWWQHLWNSYFGSGEDTEDAVTEQGAESPAPAESPEPAESPSPAAENPEVAEETPEKAIAQEKSEIYRYNNQNYVFKGEPQFYASFNEKGDPIEPVFCVKTLIPVPESVLARKNVMVKFEPFESEDHIKVEVIFDKVPSVKEALPKSLSDDPSVAQASPQAIAIAGVGGVAQTKPIATAVAGDGGLAIASPQATSIAGNFFQDTDEDYDEKKKL